MISKQDLDLLNATPVDLSDGSIFIFGFLAGVFCVLLFLFVIFLEND